MMKENKDFEQESMQMENWNTDQVKQPVIKAKKKNKMVGMLVGALCTGVVAGTAFENRNANLTQPTSLDTPVLWS